MPFDIAGLIDTYGYIAEFIGAFLEGETVLALAGLAANRGYLDFVVVCAVAAFAGFLGDQFYFFLGRFQGQRALRRFPHWKERAHSFDALLSRWHAPLIIAIRFMWGFRILGPVMLGMGRVPAWKFVFFNLVGAVIWAPIIAGIGYLFGAILETMLHDLKRFELWAFAVLLAVGLAGFAIHLIRDRRLDKESTP